MSTYEVEGAQQTGVEEGPEAHAQHKKSVAASCSRRFFNESERATPLLFILTFA